MWDNSLRKYNELASHLAEEKSKEKSLSIPWLLGSTYVLNTLDTTTLTESLTLAAKYRLVHSRTLWIVQELNVMIWIWQIKVFHTSENVLNRTQGITPKSNHIQPKCIQWLHKGIIITIPMFMFWIYAHHIIELSTMPSILTDYLYTTRNVRQKHFRIPFEPMGIIPKW